jgi:Cof subfamily protein (haloacid dehalogenase superfamily)
MMSEIPIRLIVADLDGTLLNSDHVVSPFTEKVIREALARGVLFTVATGKTFPSTPEIINLFDIQIPVICGNGTQVFAPDGTPLREDPIPRDCALEAVQMAREWHFTPIVYTGMGLLAEAWDENVHELVDHHEPAPEIVPDLEAALRNEYKPYKLVLMNRDPEKVIAFQGELERVFAGRAQVLRSGLITLVEILPSGVSKGTALEFILDYLGIPAQETMCFGDNCNDLDMIRLAGIGVAMGHAPEDVRRGADYVTGTNDEDGVAHAIQRFVLTPAPSERLKTTGV